MQAVILAGGLGTRLWPITERMPKPMVEVAGAPYLEHQLLYLRRQNVRDILLLTGYLGEQISDYFGDGSRFGLHIRYSPEDAPQGTGGALRDALPLLDDSFLLIYGDSYLPIDYDAVYQTLPTNPSVEGTIVVYDDQLKSTTVQNNIALDEEGFVSRYEKDTGAVDLLFVDAGVLALRRSVVQLVAPIGPCSLEKETFPRLIAQRQLLAFPTQQRFYDIGTPERLKAIEDLLTNDHHANALSS